MKFLKKIVQKSCKYKKVAVFSPLSKSGLVFVLRPILAKLWGFEVAVASNFVKKSLGYSPAPGGMIPKVSTLKVVVP